MTFLVASLEWAARRTAAAVGRALIESAASFRNYETGDYLHAAQCPPDDRVDPEDYGYGRNWISAVSPAAVNGSADGLPARGARLPTLHDVPTYDSLVAILTEISDDHDEVSIGTKGDTVAYCDCGQELSPNANLLGEHRAHVAEIQASAIAEAIQVARNTR